MGVVEDGVHVVTRCPSDKRMCRECVFAGKVGVVSDETTGICGGGMLKKFGEVLILRG